MNKNCLKEYPLYLTVRLLSAVIRSLPLRLNYVIGCLLGGSCYLLLKKKRKLVIKNLKTAFAQKGYKELKQIAKKSFYNLGLNIMEALYIPNMTKRYIEKYVRVMNFERIEESLAKGSGVIMLAYHFGNWELANVTSSLQNYPYNVIVNEQSQSLLDELLNHWRRLAGAKIIYRGIALRQIFKALKDNEAVAMVGDQGGKEGRTVDFFNIPTSTPEGAIKFALRTGARIIPSFIVREKYFYHKIFLCPPLEIKGQADEEKIAPALQKSNSLLQKFIMDYPQEYFWFYKIWKYSPYKKVVILSDGKTGHLRQSQAVLKIVYSSPPLAGQVQFPLHQRAADIVHSEVIEIRFRNRFARAMANLGAFFGLNAEKYCLTKESYSALEKSCADIVISCGSSLASVNLAFAAENLAKSICVMKPPVFLSKGFDLIIVSRHDRPALEKNVFVTEGAISLIDEDYLRSQADGLRRYLIQEGISLPAAKAVVSLFIGGDTKKYILTQEIIRQVLTDLKELCLKEKLLLFATTSRRTAKGLEDMIKKELLGFDNCPLLIIANEKNIPEAAGGLLGLADIAVVSAESVSMVSEAASSGRHVVAFKLKGQRMNKNGRHQRFLDNLCQKGFIRVVNSDGVSAEIKDILSAGRPAKRLEDNLAAQEALKRIL